MQTHTSNPALLTPRLHLEPLVEQHADALFPLLADPLLYRHLDHGPPADVQRLRDVYRQLQARRSPDGSEVWLNWVLVERAADRRAGAAPLGTVQATIMNDRRAWVAWVLARAAWGRGHATEAATAVLRHLAADAGVHEAMACVDHDNTRSLAVAARLGFVDAPAAAHAQLRLEPHERLLVRPLAAHSQRGPAHG